MGKPIKEIKEGVVRGAIWKNSYGGKDFYSVTLSRSYKDKSEQWKSTNTMNEKDIPLAVKVLNACAVEIANMQTQQTTIQG
jgi:hypothetical protein